MNSFEAKIFTLQHIHYRGYTAGITEFGVWYGHLADVAGLREDGTVDEFEIKTDKADLMSEVKTIFEVLEWRHARLLDERARPERLGNKFNKHRQYLGADPTYSGKNQEGKNIPNRFYFVVPDGLVKMVEPIVNQTPYGIYAIADEQNTNPGNYGNLYCIKRAKKIHGFPFDKATLTLMFRRASSENLALRRRINRATGFKCICEKIFITEKELMDHERINHQGW